MIPDVATLMLWGDIALVVAAIATTAFPLLYMFSPWYRSQVGRLIMMKALAFAMAMDATVYFRFWLPENIKIAYLVNDIVFTAISIAVSALTIQLWRMNYSKKPARSFLMNDETPGKHAAPPEFPETHQLLSDKTYNQLKWFTLIVLPAAGTLYVFMANLWDLPKAAEVSASVTGLVTFLGGVLGISTRAYNNSNDRFDGHIEIGENEHGVPVASMILKNYENPADVVNQDQVVFKVQRK